MLDYLPIIFSGGSVLIALLMYQLSLGSSNQNKAKILKFEENCIATLNTKVANLESEVKNIRENQAKLFDKLEEVSNAVAFLKGKTNGNR